MGYTDACLQLSKPGSTPESGIHGFITYVLSSVSSLWVCPINVRKNTHTSSMSEISHVMCCHSINLDLIRKNLKILLLKNMQRDKLKFLGIKQWIIYFWEEKAVNKMKLIV